jgi:hypothetical protein
MGRSTHAERSSAWAAKQGCPGYRAKKIVPSAGEINKVAKKYSFKKTKNISSEIEEEEKEG